MLHLFEPRTTLTALVLITTTLATLGCSSPPALTNIVIGTRRGEQDAVDRTDQVKVGSRQDLAATVDVTGDVGWVHATWTVWPRTGPRVVYSKSFNTTGPAKLFVSAPGDTLSAGWDEGTVTCDFKTSRGTTVAAAIRVVR
ncbi:MAG: hypothetical protein JST00_48325 [Deltaproteobacteria bacterium]|nr:hypothetical protein [Deltaproteobacteria bacterium]